MSNLGFNSIFYPFYFHLHTYHMQINLWQNKKIAILGKYVDPVICYSYARTTRNNIKDVKSNDIRQPALTEWRSILGMQRSIPSTSLSN
jgi:hypothetical protein